MVIKLERYNRNRIKNHYNNFYLNNDFIRFPLSDKYFINSLVKKFNIKKESKLMDLGCGVGSFSYYFKELGFKPCCVDISHKGILRAHKKVTDGYFVVGDATRLPFKKSIFDVVFCSGLSIFNTFDFDTLKEFMGYIKFFLKKDGIFIFVKTSTLTGDYSKNKTRINHKEEELRKLFESVYNLKIDGIYTLYPQFFPILKRLTFNSSLSKISKLNTKITGLPLRIYCIMRKIKND